MTDSDVEVLNKVLEEESGGKPYIVETRHGTITYEMRRAARQRRHEFIDSLPDELVDYMQSQADEKRDQIDASEISSLDDISEVEPDDAPTDAAMTADAVAAMEEFIVEHLNHSKITDGETRDLLEYWPDKQFFATSFLILAISGETEGIEGFRTE
ncbi:hypothetical protein [Haloarcula onubensis]|uniref:Tail assembly chaperone n=1 Tax=Haloarcula onubensis TaxID=2950539 RepID=A0ABU2FX02_9EURY|nr:hypothetical protein [Halomicroarcula sp. S3CR25-11]MDS0284676.1 hypothetical protein [Halomicroarcula sp. S3CR25-11]